MSWHRRRARRCRSDRGGDQGIVLVYTALMITVIIGMAGFAVDYGRWYVEASRLQNAIDASALGGVVFISSDFDDAEDIAKELMTGHGFPDDATVEYGYSASQIRVTASSTVDNVFTPIFGLNTTTIKRTALAEYLGPVPLGSPENHLGNDPEAGDQPDYWLNIAGPNATKISGDRFAAKNCTNAVARCDSVGAPNNLDYSDQGYFFTVGIDAPTGQDFSIELFDGIMAYVGDFCTGRTFPTTGQASVLAAIDPTHFADAATRYKAGNTGAQAVFCTGDQYIEGSDVETTVIVREPDSTPWLSADNPVVTAATCAPTRASSIAWTACSPLRRRSVAGRPSARFPPLR